MNETLIEEQLSSNKVFQIVEGDITKEEVDAIINAANSELAHGGGVAWAISQQGGPIIQQESKEWVQKNGKVSHAEPAYTSAGKLPCKYVIHAVGPVWGDGAEDAKLRDAVMGSLSVASDLGLASVSLPAISTGIFGFPKERAAKVIFAAIDDFFAQNPASSISTVRLILHGLRDAGLFLGYWGDYRNT